MSVDLKSEVKSSLPPAPYVGMRPFERSEKAIFKGREEDVTLLGNKVFASRLTILYGPSGVGKSSLLRTLLIDRIEQQDARAIYFDEWRGDNPTTTLKARLIGAATKLGIPDADRGAPSLTHLVHLIVGVDDCTLVLILDQFEEFFTVHGSQLEPFRTELAELVRAPRLDVRILISLREEHLAALEPFRAGILDLFQSTFRLEPLVPKSVREAIVAPAEMFGMSYEGDLVDEIIKDLREYPEQGVPVRPIAEAGAPTDLPILQLVCEELWTVASAKRLRQIPKDLYNRLGRKQGIVDAYLKRVIPSDWSGRYLTAQLMRHLAPPDGHKVALSARHLASVTELPLGRVESELERLSSSDVRILRTRAYEQATLYELWHDSFIRILGPWRDDFLWQWKVRRWRFGTFGVVALIIIAIGGAILWHGEQERQFKLRIHNVWDDQNRNPTQKFDYVGGEALLWSRADSGRFEFVIKELIDHERDLPTWYGVNNPGTKIITIPGRDWEWPLELHYSDLRELDPFAFTFNWRELDELSFAQAWGVPAPLKIKLVAEPKYPKTHVRLQGTNIQPLELELTADEDKALISASGVSEDGKWILQRLAKQWEPFKETEKNGPWFIVPRWSLPVWKASNVTGTHGSGVLAFRLALALQKHPEALLTADAVELLLSKVGEKKPVTVDEARRIRGARLTTDFQEFLRKGQALTGLQYLLDLLANYPDGSSANIVNKILEDLDSPSPPLPSLLRGPPTFGSPDVGGVPDASSKANAIHPAYEQAAAWLPENNPPDFRVFVGSDLAKHWSRADDDSLKRPLAEMLGRFREEELRRFGITLPRIEFRSEPLLPKDAFRIEVLNQTKDNEESASARVTRDDALSRLRSSLFFRAETYRAYLVTSESVKQELERINEPLRSWLTARYSLTDLKSLLRGVVAPSDDEINSRRNAQKIGKLDQPFDVPAESTIRHTNWLLASLVFWSKFDGQSLPELVRHLRATQHSMLVGAPPASENSNIRNLINQGFDALERDEVDRAETSFADASKIDKQASIATFLAAYPQAVERSVRGKLVKSCQEFTTGWPISTEERVDLTDIVARNDPGAADARRLRLCLLASYPKDYVGLRRTFAEEIVKQSGAPDAWPADEAAWFGAELLASFDPLEQDKQIANTGFAYIQSALGKLPAENAMTVLDEVIQTCGKDGPNQWCWKLLPVLIDANNDPRIPIAIADALVDNDPEQTLRIVGVGRSRLSDSTLSENDRTLWQNLADYTLARAYVRLDEIGSLDPSKLREAETLLERLVKDFALSGAPVRVLVSLRESQRRPAEAIHLLDTAIKRWPDNVELYAARMKVALTHGDKNAVSRIAAMADHKITRGNDGRITKKTEGFAFVTALGLLISEGPGWERAAREFLGTRHRYRPYVAMMLYSQMVGEGAQEAKQIIQRRWDEAEPGTWSSRLREGDETAFREMLIGYYLQQVPRDAVFSDLLDQGRFAQSDLRLLPMSRQEMLCEAYFYDALLAFADSDPARAQARLELTLRTHQPQFLEYAMAAYLLQQK